VKEGAELSLTVSSEAVRRIYVSMERCCSAGGHRKLAALKEWGD
jgi:hypothetical protein